MGNFLYVPVSALVFPEIASAEALSPTMGDVAGCFVGRGSYPTRTSGDIPVNPVKDMLILYSHPVTWNYRDGNVMDYPCIIKIPWEILDVTALTELKLNALQEGISAWAYSKSIFFTNDGRVRYLFRSDEEIVQQIQRLSPFQEAKNLGMIRDSCISFEDLQETVRRLPDSVEEEIHHEITVKGLVLTRFDDDLRTEIRTGACLGYLIGRVPDSIGSRGGARRAEELLNNIRDKVAYAKAERLLSDIRIMQQDFAKLVTASGSHDYAPRGITFTVFFRYKGRESLKDWTSLNPMLRKCVDFIAGYPRTNWNWYGNEERFTFMRALWNEVLKPSAESEQPSAVETLRKDAQNICQHFKSPNTVGLDVESIASPLLQAFYVTLQSSGDPVSFNRESRNARRRDYCLALFGAFKGYSYLPRTLVPERMGKPQTNDQGGGMSSDVEDSGKSEHVAVIDKKKRGAKGMVKRRSTSRSPKKGGVSSKNRADDLLPGFSEAGGTK